MIEDNFEFEHDGRDYGARLEQPQVNGPLLWFVRLKDDGEPVMIELVGGEQLERDEVIRRAIRKFEEREK